MTQKESVSGPAQAGIRARLGLALATLMTIAAGVAPVAAITMDFNGITVVISNVTNVILPELLNLVIGALPIIVVLAVVGFIVAFLDRILASIKF